MLMRNNYSEQVRQRRGGRQNSETERTPNDDAISAWAIIGNLVNFSHQVDDNKTYCAVIVQGALLYVH